jgi:hypothetical protein
MTGYWIFCGFATLVFITMMVAAYIGRRQGYPITPPTMTTVTLSAIIAHSPCVEGWANLLTHLERIGHHAEEIPIRVVLEANGIQDATWALRAAEQTEEHQRKCRLFAVWCARQVQHLADQRSIEALDVADRHANGEATDEDLDAAAHAAWQAARDACGEYMSAAWPAGGSDARLAAWHAALGLASAAAWYASRAAARADAWEGAAYANRQAQAAKFIELFCS